MKLFVTIYNDARLLGHFLHHYTRAGISQFFVAVPPEFEIAVTGFLDAFDITVCEGLDVEDSLLSGTLGVSEMRKRFQRNDEWVVIVDLDEFIEFREEAATLTAAADRMNANVVRGIMLDRFSHDGRLTEFAPDADLSTVYPIKSRFIKDVMQGCDHKGVLIKGHLKPALSKGHHWFENERTFAQTLEISHYKWLPGAINRLRESHRRVVDAGITWAVEYRRALDHYEENDRFAWEKFGGKLAEEFELEPPEHCAACGGAISEAEFAYSVTHFGKGLCRTDQRHHHSSDR